MVDQWLPNAETEEPSRESEVSSPTMVSKFATIVDGVENRHQSKVVRSGGVVMEIHWRIYVSSVGGKFNSPVTHNPFAVIKNVKEWSGK